MLAAILVLLTGCKSTRLTCTKRVTDTDEIKVDQRISLVFKKNELTEGTLALSYYYANNVEQNAKTMQADLENQYSIYKDKKGVEYYFKNLDKGLYFEIQAEVKKLSEEDKNNLGAITDYASYQSAKTLLVSDGYECK